MPRTRKGAFPLALLAAAACVSTVARPPQPRAPSPWPVDSSRVRAPGDSTGRIEDVTPPAERRLEGSRVVRIALAANTRRVTLSATGDWRISDSGGESTLLRARRGELWTVEARGTRLRAVNDDGGATALRAAPFVARAVTPGAFVAVNGKRYRGEIWVFPSEGGVTVVNRLDVEDYLRGVVPLEIGHRAPNEQAAVAAQAVAARSYAYTHLANDPSRLFDMVATVMDQVYGGVDAETPTSDAAVAATEGLVLWYHGVIVSAPYHSTCGGSTAAPSEVWRGGADEPYLVPVSDRIPGTNRYYCDISPRFRWTRRFSSAALEAVLDRYLRNYVASAPRHVGRPESVEIGGRTATGRVRALVVKTARGRYTLRGNDIRFVLRSAGGEILNSTDFSVETRATHGRLRELIVRGAGYGHGIGMCQWGAIGRARAGQDFRTILRTYYPGTVVAPVVE